MTTFCIAFSESYLSTLSLARDLSGGLLMVPCRQGRHTLSGILIIGYCYQGNTEKWRKMVTSSLNEISTEKRGGEGGEALLRQLRQPHSTAGFWTNIYRRHGRLLLHLRYFIFASWSLHLICFLHKCTICTYRRNLFTLGGT
jgi:hypothetical protein